MAQGCDQEGYGSWNGLFLAGGGEDSEKSRIAGKRPLRITFGERNNSEARRILKNQYVSARE